MLVRHGRNALLYAEDAATLRALTADVGSLSSTDYAGRGILWYAAATNRTASELHGALTGALKALFGLLLIQPLLMEWWSRHIIHNPQKLVISLPSMFMLSTLSTSEDIIQELLCDKESQQRQLVQQEEHCWTSAWMMRQLQCPEFTGYRFSIADLSLV